MCTKMVPKLLSDDHKEHRVNVCRNILETTDEEPEFLGKVITGDETWVFQYSPETKRQSLQDHQDQRKSEYQNPRSK